MKALRQTFFDLRTEGQGRVREACAIGVGLFIGCLPFYGFHLLLCWTVGRLLRLNRMKMYLAANVSNPIVAPLLVFVELQTGAWIRTGAFLALTLETARTITPWQFGAHLLVGSLAVGGVLAAIGGVATYFALGGGAHDPFFEGLARAAADRYATTSISAWEFARGKLRGDPLYRDVLLGGWLPLGGKLLDVGCGQGLMLALLAEAKQFERRGSISGVRLPRFERMVGVELRPHRARLARAALGADAEIVETDARTMSADACRVVLLFDVLHMMPRPDQDALLAAAVRALEPGGIILVREADASAGWRFQAVRFGNRLTALTSGAWHQAFAFRTVGEWLDCFSQHGLEVEAAPAGAGTPFANHLFRLRALGATARQAGSAATVPREQPA
jgi:SAM-dependent methyltransferase